MTDKTKDTEICDRYFFLPPNLDVTLALEDELELNELELGWVRDELEMS